MSSDLVDTVEMYLRTVLDLTEEGVPPLRARIAERLGHAGPTVSQTINRMSARGLIKIGKDRVLSLTPNGHALASTVLRKHRIAECFLTDIIGLEWAHAHEEACKLEHVMSDKVAERLLNLLGRPQRSPYGNLIPACGDSNKLAKGQEAPSPAFSLAEIVQAASETRRATLVWISEGLQAQDGALEHLQSIGVKPGVELAICPHGGAVSVEVRTPDTISVDAFLWDYLFATSD